MRAYEVVLRHIEGHILNGEWPVGTLLPPERELAAQLDVSRTAVREAVRSLAAQGILTSQVGAGPESGTRIAPQHAQALGKVLQMHVALGQFSVDDIVEMRVVLERSSASLLATSVSAEVLEQLGDVLAEMEQDDLSIEQFNSLDTRFHVMIAELSGNQFISVITGSVRQALALPILGASQLLSDYPSFRAGLIRQHRRIFEAIALRDAERAADLVEFHIRDANQALAISDMYAASQEPPAGVMV